MTSVKTSSKAMPTIVASSSAVAASVSTASSPSSETACAGPGEQPVSSFLASAAELAASSPSAPAVAPPPVLDEPVRLWVGNIQPHVAEYQLLRLGQPAGTITKFDFMLHGAGPQAGRPRGYAFLSYSTHREAELARRRLHGALLGGARIVCHWAHEQVLPGDVKLSKEESAAAAPPPVPALAPSAAARVRPSAEAQIRAIEAKLQHMTGGGQEQRFAVTADSDRTDVRRLPRVRGPLSRVNAPARQTVQQPKPYSRRRW